MSKIYLEPGDFVVLTSVTYCVGRVRLTDPSIDDNAATLHWHSDDECYYEVHYEDRMVGGAIQTKLFYLKEGRVSSKQYHCSRFTPDWMTSCENCGYSPVVPATELCGPCTWGEADTVGGNWEDLVNERCEDCNGECREA